MSSKNIALKSLAELFGSTAAAIVTIPTVIAYALIIFGQSQLDISQIITIGLFSPIITVCIIPFFSKIKGQISGPKAPSALFLAVIVATIQNTYPHHLVDSLIIVLIVSAVVQLWTAKMIANASKTFPSEAIDGFMIGVGILLVWKSLKYSLGGGLNDSGLLGMFDSPTGQYFVLSATIGLVVLLIITITRYFHYIHQSCKTEQSPPDVNRIISADISFLCLLITSILYFCFYIWGGMAISGAPLIAMMTLVGYFMFSWLGKKLNRKCPVSLLAFSLGVASYYVLESQTGYAQIFGQTITNINISFAYIPIGFSLSFLTDSLSNYSNILNSFVIFIIYPLLLSFIVSLDSIVSAKALDPRIDIVAEVKPQSWSNFIGAIFCAFPGGTSFPRTKELTDVGAGSKISGAIVAVFLLTPFCFPEIISFLPLPVISAIVMASGFKIIQKKVSDGLLKPSSLDFPPSIKEKDSSSFFHSSRLAVASLLTHLYSIKLVVLTVVLIMLTRSSIDGLIAGFAFFAMLLFMHFGKHYRKEVLSIQQIKGNKLRTRAEKAILEKNVDNVSIFQLEGLLFSLNLDDLCREIEELIDKNKSTEHSYIILDFDDVRAIMYESIALLIQIKKEQKSKTKILFCNIGSSLFGGESFVNHYLEKLGNDEQYHLREKPLNEAIKWVEDQILERENRKRKWQFQVDEFEFFDDFVGANGALDSFIREYLTTYDYEQNEKVIIEGKTTEQNLYFLLEGEAKLTIDQQYYKQKQDFTEIIHLQPGDIFGVLSFFDPGMSEVSVVALTPIKTMALSRIKLDEFKQQYPDVGNSIEAGIMNLLCSRVRYMFNELREIGR